jgi:hypothetical protein
MKFVDITNGSKFSKSLCFVGLVLCIVTQPTAAQPPAARSTIAKSDILISPALHIRSTLSNEYPVSINAEYLVNNWAGVGGYFGYTLGTNLIFVGAKANIHLQPLLQQKFDRQMTSNPKLDYYVGAKAGIMAGGSPKLQLNLSPCVGVRYFAHQHIAQYIEISSSPLGYISLGLTWSGK